VGVTVEGKGGTGIAAGEVGGLVRVTRFNEAEALEVGDVVETSSIGGFFPRGVRVGVIESILEQDPNDLRRNFIVRPSVDFGTLLEVVLSIPQ
jgi:rod shape-determining protein MreC